MVTDQIQLAILMGFKEIYLVGIDYSFIEGDKSGEVSGSGEVLITGEKKNHFHPNYRVKGETWTVPKLNEQLVAFEHLNAVAAQLGVKLFNASRESKLTALKKVEFTQIF